MAKHPPGRGWGDPIQQEVSLAIALHSPQGYSEGLLCENTLSTGVTLSSTTAMSTHLQVNEKDNASSWLLSGPLCPALLWDNLDISPLMLFKSTWLKKTPNWTLRHFHILALRRGCFLIKHNEEKNCEKVSLSHVSYEAAETQLAEARLSISVPMSLSVSVPMERETTRKICPLF